MSSQGAAARKMWENHAQERAAATREYEKRRAAQELAALRERVPEHLPCKYAVIFFDEKWREQSRYESDRLSQIWAHAGVGKDTTRYLIDSGSPIKVWGGWLKIVPRHRGEIINA